MRDRIRTVLPSLLLALLIAAAALAAAGPVWSKNVRVFEAQLAKVEVPKAGGFNFKLPQLRVYDAQGRRVLDVTGYGAAFSPAFTSALQGKRPADTSRLLAWELDKIRTADRQPLDPLPAADFTVVEYWAEWCLPCHAQARDMARVLAGHPDLRVNLLHVEADLKKLKPEVVRVPEEKGQGQALR